MIEFHTLGILDLRTGRDGRELGSVLAQPKRVALLAYLALATPRGFHSRDRLLGVFWPESSKERARHSLRQAIYVLRRALGEGALVARGDEELALAPESVWCDVVAFEDAVRAGERERALALYRGELLDGYHLADCPEFDRWLEIERDRLRARAVATARELADEEVASGNAVGAVHWLRQAAFWAPYDEALLRRVVELLHQTGDRSGAMREYDLFATRLDHELQLEPAAETRALVDSIRTATGARPVGSASQYPLPVSTPDECPPPDPATDQWIDGAAPARNEHPPIMPSYHRRSRFAALALVGVLSLGLAAGDHFPGDGVRTRSISSTRIAVFPFTTEGGGSMDPFGPGAAEFLSIKLDVPGRLSTVDPRSLIPAGRKAPVDRLLGQSLAARHGAGLFVLGTIMEAGGSLQITATLYDAEAGSLAAAEVHVSDEGKFFDSLDELATQLLAGHSAARGDQFARAATTLTASFPAFKAYLGGESAFRNGRYDAAVIAFQRALAIDTMFVLAEYRLALAAESAGRFDLMRAALERAWTLRQLLPDRYRLLLAGRRAIHIAQNDVLAERAFRTAAARYPDDVAAVTEYIDLLFHHGPWGVSREEVRAGFERIMVMQPDNADALLHLARLAAADRRHADLERLVERGLRLGSVGDRAAELRALRAFALRDAAGQQTVLREFRRLGDETLIRLTLRTIAYTEEFEDTHALATLLTEGSRPALVRAIGYITRAHLEAARGRGASTQMHLAAAEELHTRIAVTASALIAMSAQTPTRPAHLEAIHHSLAALEPDDAGEPRSQLATSLLDEALTVTLAGIMKARLGDDAEALGYADRLERTQHDRGSHLIRAVVARQQGRTEEALRLLGEDARTFRSEPVDFAAFLRAELLHELGRDAEALRQYQGMLQEWPLSIVYAAPAHLRSAQIYERSGDEAKAAVHYARVVELWRESDPELQPIVAHARRRMMQLAH